jgi:CDGSH-type Zn-finger protein
MKITAPTNGPSIAGGQSQLIDQNDDAYTVRSATKFALRRCGGSSRKRPGDETYAKSGFPCLPHSEPVLEKPRIEGALADWENEGGSVSAASPDLQRA